MELKISNSDQNLYKMLDAIRENSNKFQSQSVVISGIPFSSIAVFEQMWTSEHIEDTENQSPYD